MRIKIFQSAVEYRRGKDNEPAMRANRMYSKTAPLKIVIYADGESFTCNDIKDALRTTAALLQEGCSLIEMTNVTENIRRADAAWEKQMLDRKGLDEYPK